MKGETGAHVDLEEMRSDATNCHLHDPNGIGCRPGRERQKSSRFAKAGSAAISVLKGVWRDVLIAGRVMYGCAVATHITLQTEGPADCLQTLRLLRSIRVATLKVRRGEVL